MGKTLNEEITHDINEKSFNAITKFTEGAYYKYFQFKLLHSHTVINEKLNKMKLAETNVCRLCQKEPETIKHTFLEWSFVITLWKQLEKWLQTNLENNIKLDDIDKIFGKYTSHKIIDNVIICTKIVNLIIEKQEGNIILMMSKDLYTIIYV